MAETTQISTKQHDPKPQNNPFLSFLDKLNLKFPPFNDKNDKVDVNKRETETVTVEKTNSGTSVVDQRENTVRFVEKPKPAALSEPLKLGSDEEEKSTHPAVLWQVYALGGFLIVRWVWARWNERKARKGSSDDQGSDDDQEYDAQD